MVSIFTLRNIIFSDVVLLIFQVRKIIGNIYVSILEYNSVIFYTVKPILSIFYKLSFKETLQRT